MPTQFIDELKNKILVLDGATGTAIQKYNLNADDFQGKKGCNEILNTTRQDIIKEIHLNYIKAGADIIETNSFNCNRISLAEYSLTEKAYEFSKMSASLAKEVAQDYENLTGKKIWVAGSVGPTSKSASIPTGDVPYKREVSFDELKEAYFEQTEGLFDGGADIILIETIFDGLNAKAAVIAAEEVFEKKGKVLPIMISATVNKQGKLLSGQSMESLVTALDRDTIASFGLNCSFGAKDLIPLIKRLSKFTNKYISLYPNAGLPNENGEYDETPEITAGYLKELVEEQAVNILGGCCGTHYGHIKAIAELTKGKIPRQTDIKKYNPFLLSGNEIYSFKNRFTVVGERNNVAGSKIFKTLIEEKNYIKALETARSQIKNGADVIDINMDDGLLVSHEEMEKYLRVIQNDPIVSKVPVMIDSSDFKTIETALKNISGKPLVNSISLKEGEEKFTEKAKIIKKYGATAVAMAFDEEGQGVSFERKISICQRSYNILKKIGFHDSDIIFDPNILTIGTGSESDRYNGVNYLKAVQWIRENLKETGIVGGLSNLSFAFRGNNPLRASIHSLFLDIAKEKGLNFAIMNPAEKAPALSQKENDIIVSLINGEENALDDILSLNLNSNISSIKKNDAQNSKSIEDTFENRIHNALIYGGSTTFEKDIDLALEKYTPLHIIQEILMSGMEKVGNMFERGELYLPQLIRSASVMNKAIDILTPLLDTKETIKTKGKVLMATVEGDVHDIGKNIVGTVLKCNGYDIIDLGVMVPKEKIFETAVSEKVDVVTLSGLISPSLKEMEKVLKLFSENNMDIPILTAGAASSKLHTALKLEPVYKNKTIYVTDALDTLSIVSSLCSESTKEKILKEKSKELHNLVEIYNQNKSMKDAEDIKIISKSNNFCDNDIIVPKATGKFYEEFSLEKIEPFIDYNILFHDFKIKGTDEEKNIMTDIKKILNAMKENKIMLKCAYGIFPCKKAENSITTECSEKNYSFSFAERNCKNQQISLADFFHEKDYMGAFVVSLHSSLFEKDKYLGILESVLLTRIAEAGAEFLQNHINSSVWNINIRPAIGYPAIPEHSLKKIVFEMIDGEKTGTELTSSFAMTPLSSVCGIYISNPKSFYLD